MEFTIKPTIHATARKRIHAHIYAQNGGKGRGWWVGRVGKIQKIIAIEGRDEKTRRGEKEEQFRHGIYRTPSIPILGRGKEIRNLGTCAHLCN